MTQQSLKCHTAAILLGGHSSRMGGRPKFLLKDEKGQSYLKKQIKALEKADRIYLSAADESQLTLIQNVCKEDNGCHGVCKDNGCHGLIDVVKDCGPLGGLYTVLQQLKDEDEWIFVTACDVPELTESMAGGLVQMSADAYEQGYDCMVYQDSRGRLHPLCGLYRPSLLPVIQQMFLYKDYKMMHLLIRSRCLVVRASDLGISDECFVNINTPEAYERWKNSSLNMPKEQKILCICGVKNSGKTIYIEKLLKEIKAHGKSVAVIKHDGHDFEGDRPGTDTYRYHQAGAAETAIFSENRYMINADTAVSLKYLADRFSDADMIIVEGMKQSRLPKIEIVREGISHELSCCRENLIAVVTDCEKDFVGVNKWPLDDCGNCLKYLLDGQ